MAEPIGGTPPLDIDELAEAVAREFHTVYEQLGPSYGWQTQESARGKSFDELPESNRRLMVHTVRTLIEAGVIEPGASVLALFPGEAASAR